MSPEQRAIIAAAEKDGSSAIERDARLVVHGMVNATRDQMRKYQVGYDKMGEQQQDCVLADLEKNYYDLAITIARALASAGTPFVIATCKKLEVSNGNFTAVIESNQDYYSELISKVQDKSEVVIALYERQFRDGMDAIQSDKDQRSLPLEGESKPKPKAKREGSATSAAALAKKAIEIPPKLLDDAREFVTTQQNCKVSAIQNKLAIGLDKAMAVLAKLEEEGVVKFVGDEKTGEYELVRNKSAPTGKVNESGASIEDVGESAPTELTPELYEKIKAKVIADQRVSVGGLAVAFDVETDLIEQAIEELVADGTVSDSNEETGERTVLQLAE